MVVNTSQKVPKPLLRLSVLPLIYDPVTVEDLLIHVGRLETVILKANDNLEAITRAMDQGVIKEAQDGQ